MDKEYLRLFLGNMKLVFVFIICWSLAITLVWLIPYLLIYNVLIMVGVGIQNAYAISCTLALLITFMVYVAYLVTNPS